MDMAQTNKTVKNIRPEFKIESLNRKKAANLISLRIFIMVVAEAVIGGLLSGVMRVDYTVADTIRERVVPVLRIVFAVLLVAAAAYLIYAILKKVDTSVHVVTPAMLFAIVMSAAVAVAFFDRLTVSTYLFWLAAVIVCVLFLLYYVYTILMYKK